MSKHQKLDAICLVESSGLSTGAALKRLGIARSTYYRWKKKFRTMGLKGLQDWSAPVFSTSCYESISQLVSLS